MSFDDLMIMCLLGGGIGMFYMGLYKFSAFYHARQLERERLRGEGEGEECHSALGERDRSSR